ncbi:MAG: ChrR family anti-sigma-E factor [Candidatus Puniceispirillaceae bacterium]
MNEQASFNMQVLDALLLDYATGALSLPLEVLVETHLAMNEDSAKTMNMLMKLGGVLMEDSDPVSLSEGALENVLKAIEEDEDDTITVLDTRRIDTDNALLPRPISDYIPDNNHSSWRRLGIGLFECDVIFDNDQGRAKFYRIAPGTAIPSHTHTGTEVTLVLQGGFTDETGSYGPGDIAVQEEGCEHKPVADNDGECLVFAINHGDIRLTGPIGRVLNLLVN